MHGSACSAWDSVACRRRRIPELRGTPWVNGNRRSRRVQVVAGSESLISSAGGSLLAQTAAVSGLDRALSARLAPWRAGRARHDPGKIVLDLALAIGLGGTAWPTWRSCARNPT